MVAGSVESFDATTFTTNLAVLLSVSTTAIQLTVTPASVTVTANITTTGYDTSLQIMQTLTQLSTDVQGASAVLGVQVESVSAPLWTSPLDETASSAQLGANSQAGGSGLIIGVAAGVAVAVLLVALLILCVCRRKRTAAGSIPASQGQVEVLPATGKAVSNVAELSITPESIVVEENVAVPVVGLAVEPQAATVVGMASSPAPISASEEMQDWEVGSAELDWIGARSIGRGTYGVTYDVKRGGMRIAAKRMDVDRGAGRQREELERLLRREFRALNTVVHPNVVRTLGVVVDHTEYVCLLMELANGRSLRQMLDMTRDLTPRDGVRQQPGMQFALAYDIAKGMAHLHGLPRPIIHRDLKSDNVLLFYSASDGAQAGCPTAKIADFGLSTSIGSTSYATSTTRAHGGGGTLVYQAPETFKGDFSASSDVYAFAIVCWELLTAERPWQGLSLQEVMFKVVMQKERPPLPAAPPVNSPSVASSSVDVHALLCHFATRCWHDEPDARPLFRKLNRELEVAASQVPATLTLKRNGFLPPDIFISFRFGEVYNEVKALQAALEAQGLRVFVSDVVTPGGDLQNQIANALARCRLAVILASKTYGCLTNELCAPLTLSSAQHTSHRPDARILSISRLFVSPRLTATTRTRR